jgi:hypothetical protein
MENNTMGITAISSYRSLQKTDTGEVTRRLSPDLVAEIGRQRAVMHNSRNLFVNMFMGDHLDRVERAADAITRSGPYATVAQLINLRAAVVAARDKALERRAPNDPDIIMVNNYIRRMDAVINPPAR